MRTDRIDPKKESRQGRLSADGTLSLVFVPELDLCKHYGKNTGCTPHWRLLCRGIMGPTSWKRAATHWQVKYRDTVLNLVVKTNLHVRLWFGTLCAKFGCTLYFARGRNFKSWMHRIHVHIDSLGQESQHPVKCQAQLIYHKKNSCL